MDAPSLVNYGAALVSVICAIWAFRTQMHLEKLKGAVALAVGTAVEKLKGDIALDVNARVERLKGEITRDLQSHEVVLKIASEVESRFHERDLAALQECQKTVAQFFVGCLALVSEMGVRERKIGADASSDAQLSDIRKTYRYLRPFLALAPEAYRGELEDEIASAMMLVDHTHGAWIGGVRPDEGERQAILQHRRDSVARLDRWAKDLRDYQIRLVLEVAKQLEVSRA